MIVSDPYRNRGWQRNVLVQCCQCKQSRWISWNFARQSHTHICRRCASKQMIQDHPEKFQKCTQAMANANRAKARQGSGRIQSGYRQIYMPEHPRAKGGGPKKVVSNGKTYVSYGQYIYEHNHVIEQHTGQHPAKHEIVHHINSNKLDNRIENLYVCSGRTKKESSQIHNACHYSAEQLTMQLVERGIVEFVDGQYTLTDTTARLFAEVFDE